jgi:hypothetical protein
MAIVMCMSYMLTRKINVNRVVERLTTCQAAESKQAEVVLRKGVLFEFTKESGKSLLAVVQKAEGKRTWIAMDQVGPISILFCREMIEINIRSSRTAVWKLKVLKEWDKHLEEFQLSQVSLKSGSHHLSTSSSFWSRYAILAILML